MKMENKKFVLIVVSEREIETPQFFAKFDEAQSEMRRDYMEMLNGCHDEGEIGDDYAYLTSMNHDNVDWKIFEI